MEKGNIVEIVCVEQDRRKDMIEYVGRQFKIKGISSPVWKYNIYLEPLQSHTNTEELMEKFFLERNAWGANELKVVQ